MIDYLLNLWHTVPAVHLFATVVGHLYLLCMVLRLGTLAHEMRTLNGCMIALQYEGSRMWLIITRYAIPSLLAAPSLFWTERFSFFNHAPAPELWEVARFLVEEYGSEPTDEGEASNLPAPVAPVRQTAVSPNRRLLDATHEPTDPTN